MIDGLGHEALTEMLKCSFKAVAKRSCSVQERRGCQVTTTSFTTKRFNSKKKKKNQFYTAAPTTTLGTGWAPGGLNRGILIFL